MALFPVTLCDPWLPWLQTFQPPNPGGSQEHNISLTTNSLSLIFAFIIQFKHKRYLDLFDMFLFYDWPFFACAWSARKRIIFHFNSWLSFQWLRRLLREFQIIPMHTMNRERIPSRKRGFDGVLYKLWPLLTPWSAASMLLAAPREPKQTDLAGRWLAKHTSPVSHRAKPDSRPRPNGARLKYASSPPTITPSSPH